MNEQTRQIASFNASVPLPRASSMPAAVGASANFLRSGLDFAEFRGVPLEGRILNVRLQYAAMRNLRAALAAEKGEVLGLLLGSHSAQTLCIEGYEPVLLAGENPDFSWLRAAAARFTAGAPGLIGLFRTQLAGRPEITPADSDLIRKHLPNLSENGGFFAVIETPRSNPWSATLFALGSAGTPTPGNSMLEFPFNENLLRKTFSNDFVPEFESPRPKEIPASTSAKSEVAKRISGVAVGVDNSRLWMVGALCVAGVLGLGVFYDRQYPFSGRTQAEAGSVASYQPLGLKVARSGSDFEVSWDRTSSALRLASDGTLTIRDGHITKIVNLDSMQLREGRILYAPLFRELTVRLEVSENRRRMAGESVQVLGWDTNPSSGLSADLSISPAPASQKSEPLAQLMVPPIASAGREFAGLAANRTAPRATEAPVAGDKQSPLSPPSVVAKVSEPKAVTAEARRTVPALPTAPQPRPAIVTPTQIPGRASEPAVQRFDAPAAPVPTPVTAAAAAVAVPSPALSVSQAAPSQPVALQPVVSQPAASKPAVPQPVAPQRAVLQPVASLPVASQPVSLTSNLQAAKLIKMVTPVYPSLARATRIEGTVRFNASIGGDGRIRKLQYTGGPSVLVSAAADAVKQWIYQPTVLDGRPIEIDTNIDVVFSLKSK